MFVPAENTKELTQTHTHTHAFIQLISTDTKAAGYMANKLNITSYTVAMGQAEFEMKNTTPFSLAPKEMTCLAANLIQLHAQR